MTYDNGGMQTTSQQFAQASSMTDSRRLSPRICVTIEAQQKQRVDKQCALEHRTQSEIVRLALRLYYEGKDEFGRPNRSQQPTS